jgi:hypothetical protein
MDSIIDESLDPISRTPTGIDQMTQVQSLSDDLMPDDSSEIPTNTATIGAFLVANWLVGQGEG